jgi:hypothetical protein
VKGNRLALGRLMGSVDSELIYFLANAVVSRDRLLNWQRAEWRAREDFDVDTALDTLAEEWIEYGSGEYPNYVRNASV